MHAQIVNWMEYLSSYHLPYQHQQGSKHQPLQRMDCSWRLIWTSRDKLESQKPRGKRRQRMDQSSPKPESVKPTMTQMPQKSGMSISLIRNKTKYNMAWRENVYSRRPQVPECIYQLDSITLYPIGWIPACSKQSWITTSENLRKSQHPTPSPACCIRLNESDVPLCALPRPQGTHCSTVYRRGTLQSLYRSECISIIIIINYIRIDSKTA